MRPTTTSIKEWWNTRNELFTMMCGPEEFTNGNVVLMHLFLFLVLLLCVLAEWLEGGAL